MGLRLPSRSCRISLLINTSRTLSRKKEPLMTRSNCLCSNRSSTSLCNHRSPTSSKPSSRSNRPSEWRCSCSDCARLGVAWQFAHLIVDILELCYAIKMDITSRARLWSACLYDFYCRTAGKSSKPQCQTQYILPNTAYSAKHSIFYQPQHIHITHSSIYILV